MLIVLLALIQAAAPAADTPVSTGPPPREEIAPPSPVAVIPGPPPVDGAATIAATRPGQLFISPMGEPFRAQIGAAYPVDAWFARADADRDGALSSDEFVTDARVFFAVLDAGGDGVIDGFEDSDYEARIAPEVAATGFAPGGETKGRRGFEPAGAARYGLLPEPQPVRSADADLDFRITAAEWDHAAVQRFTRLDSDRDGRLARTELPETFEQERLKELADKAAADSLKSGAGSEPTAPKS